MVDATRALVLGGPVADVVKALVWMVATTAVFAPLAVRAYKKRS